MDDSKHEFQVGLMVILAIAAIVIMIFRFGDIGQALKPGMPVNIVLPSAAGGLNHPNGYGVLTMEAETTASATLTVDVLDANDNLVVGKDGTVMSGLSGDIIELWEIDSSDYPNVKFRFNFDLQ